MKFCAETATFKNTYSKPAKVYIKKRKLAPGQQARIQAKLNEWYAVVGNDTTTVEVKEMEDFLAERTQKAKSTREEFEKAKAERKRKRQKIK